MKIFSFFSGCGILDLGFSEFFDICYANEYNKKFMLAYTANHTQPEYGYHCCSFDDIDISKYIDKCGDFGFIAGPPCPDFSIAGKRAGERGSNGRLTTAYIQAIIRYKPAFFVFENVKGLIQDHPAYYTHIIHELKNAGYDVTSRLCNALEFGVPQFRERVFIIGFRSGLGLDIRIFDWRKGIKYNLKNILTADFPKKSPLKLYDTTLEVPMHLSRYKELMVYHWFAKNDVENHANQKLVSKTSHKKISETLEGQSVTQSNRRLHRYRYSFTICYGNNNVFLHPTLPRCVTIAESLALQSVPKHFVLPNSLGTNCLYKTISNGVPYLMARGIADSVYSFLLEYL